MEIVIFDDKSKWKKDEKHFLKIKMKKKIAEGVSF